SVREREVGRDPLDLRLRQPEQVSMAAPPAAMEAQQDQSARSLLIGPEPSTPACFFIEGFVVRTYHHE
ncbi:hypothetical protein, partial [Teichococcus vastitatis]